MIWIRESRPPSVSRSVTWLWKQNSPPISSICRRRVVMMVIRRSVPRWGFLIPQNLFGGAGLHEQLQHFPVSSGRVFYGGIQFSIGEGTRTALPELNIALGIQGSSGPEGVHLLFSHGGLVASLRISG